MDKPYKGWLEGLKVGDQVIVSTYEFGHATHMPSEVVKITPTGGLRIKGYTSRLFKNGKVPPSAYSSSYALLEPTPEIVDKINLSRMRGYLKNVVWDKVDDDVVKQVRELLR